MKVARFGPFAGDSKLKGQVVQRTRSNVHGARVQNLKGKVVFYPLGTFEWNWASERWVDMLDDAETVVW